MLRGESEARCPHEGTSRRGHRSQSSRHSSLVPEQAMQGQEEDHTDKADAGTAKGVFLYPQFF